MEERAPMKAITLTQPWATLVAIGAKRIETRSWPTAYRGRLAIHAAKGFPLGAQEECHREPFASALRQAGVYLPKDLPRGVVVATCRLASCWQFDARIVFRYSRPFSELMHTKRMGWLLRQLADRVDIHGQLGIGYREVDSAPNGQLGSLLLRHQERQRSKNDPR